MEHWYAKLLRQLPQRLLADKSSETFRKFWLRRALTQIAGVALQRQSQAEQAQAIADFKTANKAKSVFVEWVKMHRASESLKVWERRQRRRTF